MLKTFVYFCQKYKKRLKLSIHSKTITKVSVELDVVSQELRQVLSFSSLNLCKNKPMF